MHKQQLVNKFFDINKLPPTEGILMFPISMSRISNTQSAEKCWEYLKIFSPDKIIKPLVGVNFIYADLLYFNSSEEAAKLKSKFTQLMLAHKHEFLKIVSKNPFYIAKAFTFTTWSQMILECKEYTTYLGLLKKFYKKDRQFQKYVEEDAKSMGRKLDENQINFILEEIFLVYMLSKGKIALQNEYIQGHQKWILWCYPGKPLKSQIYLMQKNIFKLSHPKNTYKDAFYDLEARKLYDFTRVDLENLNED